MCVVRSPLGLQENSLYQERTTEDCESWWLSSCRNSVAEHWLHKPGVLGLIHSSCGSFYLSLFCLNSLATYSPYIIPFSAEECSSSVRVENMPHGTQLDSPAVLLHGLYSTTHLVQLIACLFDTLHFLTDRRLL